MHTDNLLNVALFVVVQGAPAPSGRRGKRGGGGGGTQQGYPPHSPYSPQPHFQPPPPYQQAYQQQYQQYQQSAGQSPVLLQPLSLQPPQLLQPGLMSPAAAAAYYGSPSPMQHMQHSPASPMLDPNAMALLFGGMSMAGAPMSPGDPTGAMAAGMIAGQFPGYAIGMASPTIAVPAGGMHAAGMLSPMGGMLSPVPDAAALGGQSPLPQPLMHPATSLHSPY